MPREVSAEAARDGEAAGDAETARDAKAARDAEEALRKRKLRRNGISIIAVINVLVLADGISGVADLHRRATVQGSAAAWADAATAADCDGYTGLETAARLAADLAGVTPTATLTTRRAGLCKRVADGWLGVSITGSQLVERAGDAAVVRLTVTGEQGGVVTGELLMSHADGRWRVDEPPAPCPSPSYTPDGSLCPAITLPGG